MTAKRGTAMFLPAWNEADNLPIVVSEAVLYLHSRNEPFVVIIVDDGSTDNTAEVARMLEVTYPGHVRLVQHRVNKGYGAALRTGFKACLESNFEWNGFCDADGQFKPQDIGKLITSAVESDSDIAIGYRIARADNFKRRMMGRAWHKLSRALLGYKAIDVDCGFKVFRRHALHSLNTQLAGNHATISPEILARAFRAGLKVVEVGIDHFPRNHGTQSGSSLNVIWESVLGLVLVRQNINQSAELKRKVS
ncbi:MAG: glycosyltransferase family 2 protein [Candidatus Saccharimonadales bacterium]